MGKYLKYILPNYIKILTYIAVKQTFLQVCGSNSSMVL